jgi:hypothetical protein
MMSLSKSLISIQIQLKVDKIRNYHTYKRFRKKTEIVEQNP